MNTLYRDFYDFLVFVGFAVAGSIILGVVSLFALMFLIALSPIWITAVICKTVLLIVRAFARAKPKRAAR